MKKKTVIMLGVTGLMLLLVKPVLILIKRTGTGLKNLFSKPKQSDTSKED